MKKLNFQFHARYFEITQFLQSVIEENAIKVYGINLFPYCRKDILRHIGIHHSKMVRYRFIMLSKHHIEIGASEEYNQFISESRGNLFITIGEDNGTELFESAMWVTCDDKIGKLWIKIINQFKRPLLKGAFVTSPNGLSQYYPNHRYSQGAKQAYDNAVIIRARAGWNHFELR